IAAVVITAVIAVFVAASETFAEIIVVFRKRNVIRIISVARIHVSIRLRIIVTPAVLPVGHTGTKTFLITIVHRLAKHLRTVLAGVVILAASIITVVIHEVAVILCLPQTHLIASDLFPIPLLVFGIASAVFASKLAVSLVADLLPVVPAVVVFPLPFACQTLLSG